MELLWVGASLAVILAMGGLAAAAFVHLPRLIAASGGGELSPQWLQIVISYVISLTGIKVLGALFPGGLFFLAFVFLITTSHHLVWLLKAVSPASRVKIAAGTVALTTALVLSLASAGAHWPLALGVGFARIFT